MASGSKTDSIFTRSGMGSGPSTGLVRSKHGKHGDDDLAAYPQDNIHGVDLPSTRGGKMGGGVDNLSHSLSGTSAVQRSKGKPESSGI